MLYIYDSETHTDGYDKEKNSGPSTTGADPGFGNGGGGGKILNVVHKSVADHPPLRGFPEATIKVYTCIF